MKLIDDWHKCHRFWSVRLSALAAVLLTLAQEFPDALSHVWLIVPDDIRAEIPHDFIQWLGIVAVVVGIVARLIRQDRLHADEHDAIDSEGRKV